MWGYGSEDKYIFVTERLIEHLKQKTDLRYYDSLYFPILGFDPRHMVKLEFSAFHDTTVFI